MSYIAQHLAVTLGILTFAKDGLYNPPRNWTCLTGLTDCECLYALLLFFIGGKPRAV